MSSSNFSSLRANRATALAKLNEEAKKESAKQGADERFWKLTVDAKTKVGYARIRFLPAPKGEDVPWQRIFNHAFKFNGQWFIENCPTTLGQRACPVCKANSLLWNSADAKANGNQDVARERKRSLRFIGNILVIDDPAHPENNGKVFLYKYGKKIKDKVQQQMNPLFPNEVPTNPFDMWTGGDFKLKAQEVSNFQNYDNSVFGEAKELFPGDDDKKEALWEKEYPLLPLVAENQFKSYEAIERRFLQVTQGIQGGPQTAADAIKAEQPSVEEAVQTAAALDAEDVDQAEPTQPKKRGRPKKVQPAEDDETIASRYVSPEPEQSGDDGIPQDEATIQAFFSDMLDPTTASS